MNESHATIAHVTSVHAPDDVRIYHKQCRTLAAAGYRVCLIAATDAAPAMNGIKLVKIPRPRNRFDRFTRTQWRLLRRALEVDARVYHFHDPELIGLGILLRLFGKAVIYDAHEDLPRAVLSKHWIPAMLRPITSRLTEIVERVAVRWFDAVVAATPSISRRFPDDRAVLVQNYPLPGELRATGTVPYCERPSRIAYVGGVSRLRGAIEMAQAVNQLPGGCAPELVVVGDVPKTLHGELSALGRTGRLRLTGHLSRTEVSEILGTARIGLVLFHPAPNHVEAQPNKLFEYMSAGLPVVASDFPLWRELVSGVGCGLLVDPLDPPAIASAMAYLLDHPSEAEAMGLRGLYAVRERLNWTVEGAKLEELYATLCR